MENTKLLISNEQPIARFKHHLQNNERVLLSARFGDGKTTFLNEFKKVTEQEYEYITIYPVNYQVAENKDIFEYIKRDILIQLLCIDDLLLDDEKFEQSIKLWSYLCGNEREVVKDILSVGTSFIPIVGGGISKGIEKLINHYNQYTANSKVTEQGEEDVIIGYISSFKDGVYEFDPISRLICELVQRYTNDRKKQLVFVIEDLDRIDPKHLFRILNIFSAHIDRTFKPLEEEAIFSNNKFGFDKIVFVCHFENIQKIFHHFYGADTDFKGYITKFSTSPEFVYSLATEFEKHISSLIHIHIQSLNNLILEWLTKEIISRYQNKNIEENLRTINQKLSEYKPSFINKYIFKDGIIDYAIEADNPFTRFLDIANKFRIDGTTFLTKMGSNREADIAFYDLIGANWFLHPEIEIRDDKYTYENRKGFNINIAIDIAEKDGLKICGNLKHCHYTFDSVKLRDINPIIVQLKTKCNISQH